MSTYSEQQGGPGAVLWAVIITIILIGIIIFFSGCEKPVTYDMRGEWNGSNGNITLTLDLLQTGTVITGSGQCFPSSISLVLSAKGMDNIFYNAVFTDRFTTQGEFYTNQSLILTKQ